MTRLSRRLDRLESTVGPTAAYVGAVDRPPRETRAEWLERTAATFRGEHVETGSRNAWGETWAEWLARRRAELNLT